MQSTSEMIFQEALKLPEPERLTLISRLMDTMPSDDSLLSLDDDSLVDELDRRFADSSGSVTWSELLAEKQCQTPR
jgi:putative addiction module component (TIGR02574 family)